MKLRTVSLATSAAIRMANQKRILNHINSYPERQAELARKEYKRFNLITILIILLVLFPLCIYTISSLTLSFNHPEYPNGATKEINGHISLYKDTFWYTDSSQKYEFDLNPHSLLVMGIIIVYAVVFYILIDNCEVEMHRIKTGYYDKK